MSSDPSTANSVVSAATMPFARRCTRTAACVSSVVLSYSALAKKIAHHEFVMMAKQVLQLRYQPRISRLDPVGEAAFSFDICSVFVEMDAERGESPDKLRARGTAAH